MSPCGPAPVRLYEGEPAHGRCSPRLNGRPAQGRDPGTPTPTLSETTPGPSCVEVVVHFLAGAPRAVGGAGRPQSPNAAHATYTLTVARCPKAVVNPATKGPVDKKDVYKVFKTLCYDDSPGVCISPLVEWSQNTRNEAKEASFAPASES